MFFFFIFYLTILLNNNRILLVAALMPHNHLLEKCQTYRYGHVFLTLKRQTTKLPVPSTSLEMLSLGVSPLWNFMEGLSNIHLTLVSKGPSGLPLLLLNPQNPTHTSCRHFCRYMDVINKNDLSLGNKVHTVRSRKTLSKHPGYKIQYQ